MRARYEESDESSDWGWLYGVPEGWEMGLIYGCLGKRRGGSEMSDEMGSGENRGVNRESKIGC